MLEEDEYNELARLFAGDEIKRVVFYMGAFKAPGLYGYQALFFQRYWDITGGQFIHMVLKVLRGRTFPKSLNDTFLVLIPKVENPQSVTQLRPISLCNFSYKAITKSIANRIKPVLSKLIAHTQSSFVPGRQILDNIIIA